MPRSDAHESEYPPGLDILRNGNGYGVGIGVEEHRTNGFSHMDRRGSSVMHGGGGYPIYASSRGMAEQQHWEGVGATGPNRHIAAGTLTSNAGTGLGLVGGSSFHHHHQPSQRHAGPSPLTSQISPNTIFSSPPPAISTSFSEREAQILRPSSGSSARDTLSARSTLCWGDLEPWMDEEYAKQVCALMGWDPVNVKVPHPAPDPATGQQANNPGYCFLTFPSPAHAASILAQMNNPAAGAASTMPNSTKPFVLSWASATVPSTTSTPVSSSFVSPTAITGFSGVGMGAGAMQPQYPKEYSIFVGDLAPETSNSDLVAVFRNPVLGLRNDREPKFIRPFLSCKSAKIMLDPITGVSRGYGFVRFTDEADQQRALIEMHGLYCLSRPMRISPATAKFKPPPNVTPQDIAQLQQLTAASPSSLHPGGDPVTIALPLPGSTQPKSVSAPIASSSASTPVSNPNSTSSTSTSNSASSLATTASTSASLSSLGTASSGTGSSNSLASNAFNSKEDVLNGMSGNVLAQLYSNEPSHAGQSAGSASVNTQFVQQDPSRAQLPMDYNPAVGTVNGGPRYLISEESWKHHAQARAILGNLIGPNGEQLTSTDPYNTTVFVGGLSPLIQEETLRTFFAPFGDIHYVKVPVGKHCGFVQFVRKADAERAIEKMQGFPIGGSRIRLSWGRSQYKAAQAAAQAAQAAALQSHGQYPISVQMSSHHGREAGQLTQEQALQLLQKLSLQGYLDSSFPLAPHSNPLNAGSVGLSAANGNNGAALDRMFVNTPPTAGLYAEDKLRSAHLASREDLVGSSSYEGTFKVHGHSFSGQHLPHQHLQGQLNHQDIASSIPTRLTTFSPFSPDPNGVYTTSSNTDGSPDLKRRGSYGGRSASTEGLSRPSKAYMQGFGAYGSSEDLPLIMNVNGVKVENISGVSTGTNTAKISPTSTRPPSGGRYANYQGGLGTSPVNKNPIPIPISRPTSGQPHSSLSSSLGNAAAHARSNAVHDSFDAMHDLNGTLASLDLGDSSNSSFGGANHQTVDMRADHRIPEPDDVSSSRS